ncbi:NnrS family protein [Pseudidiomarina sp. 1APP75-27a]|uniref:NnrS family protein n=1 Tax=Pseudidiomarina terrestris TaxID=2820060 RepID=UPI0026501AE9|nr:MULTISPECIES: NnrS family protein [unclassified Pseudidiomarina]MDN7125822.1 NnrS family protein [Pseudidiomarina sp. 1APR75-33.1]MEA3588248.1 NnrS family protein [Pseudidiomarina sp. 1APP75-27a]
MLQITDLQVEEKMWPLLRQAFRPMFLLGATFSALAMMLWLWVLSGSIQLPVFGDVMFWHSHEMIFGFVAAIIVGFLLTAVQNWTGLRATHGKALGILTLVWLLGRLGLLFGAFLPPIVPIVIDLAFLPLAAVLLAMPLISVKQQRNLFFVPVLLLLALCNALMYYGHMTGRFDLQQVGSQNAVILITLLMAIVGGRVLPMFTANGTMTEKVQPIVWLDRLSLGSLWLIFALQITQLSSLLSGTVMAALYAVAAVLLAIRCARWKIWITWRVPLLWSFHLAYWFLPVGLGLFALHHATGEVSVSTAIHALTVGAMGNMILSMLARVSLGHSGRPLQPKKIMSVAFLLVFVAALLRVFAAWLWPQDTYHWYLYAGGAWVLAYLIYVVVYLPILTLPRADGRPG